MLHFAGQHEQAIESFERALRLDPQFHLWIHARGRAQFALKRYDEAEASFKRRLIHMPHSDVTRAYLASLSRDGTRPRKSRDLLELGVLGACAIIGALAIGWKARR